VEKIVRKKKVASIVILSPKKLTLHQIKSKGLMLNSGTRAFREQGEGAFESVIAKAEFHHKVILPKF